MSEPHPPPPRPYGRPGCCQLLHPLPPRRSPHNPNLVAFSPSLASPSTEETSNWLQFSPSSSNGTASGHHLLGPSPGTSFADVVRGKGKASMKESSPSPPKEDAAAAGSSFMADARRTGRGRAAHLKMPPVVDDE
jgi:hypothetical protein